MQASGCNIDWMLNLADAGRFCDLKALTKYSHVYIVALNASDDILKETVLGLLSIQEVYVYTVSNIAHDQWR